MSGADPGAGCQIVQRNGLDHGNTVVVGTTSLRHPVRLNRESVKASAKIRAGLMEARFVAGFPGGPNTVPTAHLAALSGDPQGDPVVQVRQVQRTLYWSQKPQGEGPQPSLHVSYLIGWDQVDLRCSLRGRFVGRGVSPDRLSCACLTSAFAGLSAGVNVNAKAARRWIANAEPIRAGA